MNGRVLPLGIPGAALIEAAGSGDERGEFFEYLRDEDLLRAVGCGLVVEQVNYSVSVRGALRGIAVTDVPPRQAKPHGHGCGEVR